MKMEKENGQKEASVSANTHFQAMNAAFKASIRPACHQALNLA